MCLPSSSCFGKCWSLFLTYLHCNVLYKNFLVNNKVVILSQYVDHLAFFRVIKSTCCTTVPTCTIFPSQVFDTIYSLTDLAMARKSRTFPQLKLAGSKHILDFSWNYTLLQRYIRGNLSLSVLVGAFGE